MKESNFKIVNKHLGTLKVGQSLRVYFPYEGDLKILSVKASCGCTSAKNDVKSKSIVATYTAKPIPLQLKSQGFYTPTNYIKVTFEDGSQETLSFSVKVEK